MNRDTINTTEPVRRSLSPWTRRLIDTRSSLITMCETLLKKAALPRIKDGKVIAVTVTVPIDEWQAFEAALAQARGGK